jgi:hypothetical protein
MKRLISLFCLAVAAIAQPPGRPFKPVPPPGIEPPAQDRAELQSGLQHLKAAIDKLQGNPLLVDVLIYHEAVRYALQYNEFFKADEIAKAKALLQHGEERARQLAQDEAPWTTSTGLVVRGYVSKIDKSVQPYGLVAPPSYSPNASHRWRLDTWFHGRNETLSEVNSLSDRERNRGEFTPRDTIVLHLYGRFCNASKLAAGAKQDSYCRKCEKSISAQDVSRRLVANFLRTPGTHYLDFSMFKNFRFREKLTTQFRAEAYNFTNSPTWATPNVNVTQVGQFGTITSASGQRKIQLALKLLF